LSLVLLFGARITGKVFVRPELGRIDKNADHDPVCMALSTVHQLEMTGVKIAHRRHEGDTVTGFAPAMDEGPQRGNRGNGLHQ